MNLNDCPKYSKAVVFICVITQIPVRVNVYYAQIPVHYLAFDTQIPIYYLALNTRIHIILISICDSSTHYSFNALRFFICIHATAYNPDKEAKHLEYICTLYYTYMYLFYCYVKKKDSNCNIAYFAINKNFKEQIIREVFKENHIKNYNIDKVILELDKINTQIIRMNSNERYSKYIAYIFKDKKEICK